MFGERAGVMDIIIDGEPITRRSTSPTSARGAAAALVSRSDVFADWRRTVSLNVTLFVLTASILLIILYAYFSQAARAQVADRIYAEAHQRIDLALARGRCGLWDWDMVRGKMYWSRSMYDMLGYEACDRMLSFGEVADIIHDEDGDLFDIATKSCRARSTTSTRYSACATPPASGYGCASGRMSSTRRRRKSS